MHYNSLYAFHQIIYENFNEADLKHKLFRNLARQYGYGESILNIEWLSNNQKEVYLQPDFGTDMGICDWVTPNFNETDSLELIHVKPGSETGSNNGLQLILDAETFDYGTPTV